MAQGPAAALPHVDKFFQHSLLGLLTSGYFAVVGSAYLDLPTVIVTAAALLIRAPSGRPAHAAFPAAGSHRGHARLLRFYPLDYFYLSKSFIPATVHLVFFVAVVKILTASTERDYLYLTRVAGTKQDIGYDARWASHCPCPSAASRSLQPMSVATKMPVVTRKFTIGTGLGSKGRPRRDGPPQ